MRKALWPIWILAWLIFLTLPIGFLLARSGTPLDGDWFGGLYTACVELFGEPGARWIFSALWLALNGLLFWRFVLSKRRHELDPPMDADD
jgi:hypothetical protein